MIKDYLNYYDVDADSGTVYFKNGEKVARTLHKGRYEIHIFGKTIQEHIVIAKAFPEICGEWFEGCHIHHKDFNELNNSAYNLQVMTAEEHRKLHKESEISKKRKSNARKGKTETEEHKSNISKGLKVAYEEGRRTQARKVIQIFEDGTYKEYKMILEASEQTNIPRASIQNVVKHNAKTAYGSVFIYKEEFENISDLKQYYKEQFIKEEKGYAVEQYSIIGIKINEFKSAAEAEKITNINQFHIGDVCKGKRKKAGGFIWKYKNGDQS